MIRFNTTRFGELSVPEDKVITFKDGIPGFSDCKRFILMDYKDTKLKWLQSVDNPDLAFIIAEANYIEPSYKVNLDNSVKTYLEVERGDDVLTFVILRVDNGKVVANFNGPLVFNSAKMLAAQVIIDKL